MTSGRFGLYGMRIPGAYIAGNFVTTRVAQRRGDRRMIGIGQVFSLAGVGLTLALALADWKHPRGIALPLMLLDIGHGLLMPAALVGTVGLVPHTDALGLALLMLPLTSVSVAASAVLWRRA